MKPRPAALALLGLPVVAGAWVMQSGGAPSARWAGHLGVGVLGLLLYFAVVRAPRLSHKGVLAVAFAGAALIGSSLCAPGLQGVHRWIFISGVRMHPSQLVMPGLLVLVAGQLRRSPAFMLTLLAGVQMLHLLQPDAGQATAVAAASLVICLGAPTGVSARVCLIASLAAAAATWIRADPLAAAPFVEDVVTRAFATGWWLGCFSLVSLAGASLAPMVSVWLASGSATVLPGPALSVYLATAMIVTAFGPFPVPLLGFGASSVLGAFLGLAALHRAEQSAAKAVTCADGEIPPEAVVCSEASRAMGGVRQPSEVGSNL